MGKGASLDKCMEDISYLQTYRNLNENVTKTP